VHESVWSNIDHIKINIELKYNVYCIDIYSFITIIIYLFNKSYIHMNYEVLHVYIII